MERSRAESLLRQMLGPAAQFRDGQWEAIEAIVGRRERLLVVQRTGWGKSLVYFLATKVLREAGRGPTLLISPLLSLMRNQIAMAERLSVRAATIHSENFADWPATASALRENRCDLLMVSPERLGNREFLQTLLPLVQGQIGLFVVDEAHCISDWGHDFRPDYRRIVRVLRHLPAGVPVLCTTATANDRVVRDVQSQIAGLNALRGPLVRPSLKLFTIKRDDQAERLAWLAQTLPRLAGSGIIYTLTIQDARRVAEWLQRRGLPVRQYHADLPAEQRVQLEQMLLENNVKALVATVALGMGFDKPDLGFVIHFQRPGSVVAYYQQVGRAGRAVDEAFGILLSGREDDEIVDYFIRTAFPPAEVMEEVLEKLERSAGLTLDGIVAQTNHPRGVIEKALKLLEVDDAVVREKSVYHRTANRWTPDVLRAEQVTQLRRAEVAQMRAYVGHTGCLMEFLARALDDPSPAPCGRCMNCTGDTTRQPLPASLIQEAVGFLRGDALEITPKKRWPVPVLPELREAWPAAVGETSAIPETLRPCPGRVLCIWGDAGWGREVAHGKYQAHRFSDALVEAVAELVRQRWKPEPLPAWVAAVPSLRREALVAEFAGRVAGQLGLPFRPVLQKARETPPQKEMQNSATQLRNLLGAFTVAGEISAEPVLLVDDVVDSGWTLTVLAVLLRQHGSGPVYPLALAKSSPGGS